MAKQFYRVGTDIYDASTNTRITKPDWEANWTGRATEVVNPNKTGAQAFTEATGGQPTSQSDIDAINEYNSMAFPATALDEQATAARQKANAFNPSLLLQILKQGMKIKQKPEQVSAGLPTSLMQGAGLPTTGKEAAPILLQALDFQRNRITKSTAEVTAFLSSANDIFRDQAAILQNEANRLSNEQNALRQRAFQIEDNITAFNDKISLMKLQDQLEREMIKYQQSLESNYTLKETNEGYAVFNNKSGELIPLDKSGRRTDRNNNPIAVSNAKTEWLDILKQNGINYTLEQGADFEGGLKTIKFPDLTTGVEGARVLLGQSDAFYWYKNHTGKQILDSMNINSPQDFAALDKENQDKIISNIYKNENGGGSGLTVAPKNSGGYTDQELKKLRAAGIDPSDIEKADAYLYPKIITDKDIIEAIQADTEAGISVGDIISVLESQGKDPFNKKYWPFIEKAIVAQIKRNIENGMTEKEIREDLKNSGLSDEEIDQFKDEIDEAPNAFTRFLGF